MLVTHGPPFSKTKGFREIITLCQGFWPPKAPNVIMTLSNTFWKSSLIAKVLFW